MSLWMKIWKIEIENLNITNGDKKLNWLLIFHVQEVNPLLKSFNVHAEYINHQMN